MINTLLPNHAKSILKEMTGMVEEQIFKVDMKRWVGNLYQKALEIEFEQFMDLSPYERNPQRRDQRNGFYQRSLDTVYGWIEDLRVPRSRQGLYQTKVFERYQRREVALDKMISECYLRGISTRDVTCILEKLCDVKVSSSSVSRITKQWQQEAFRFHQRKILDDYMYLFLDGVWIKNRSLGKTKRLVLVAFGIRQDGTKEIIDYQLSQTEKEEHWARFLTFLSHRGLAGRHLKLIVTDGCHGLWNAVDMVYPGIAHQTCWAHKMRNVLGYVKPKDHKAVHQGLSKIFSPQTTTQAQAQRIINQWKKQWKKIYPQAVRSVERCEDKLLAYLNCPPEHHKAIRTSNHIERVFREFRRRMRSQEILPNQYAADRMLFALSQVRNEKLKRFKLQFTQLKLH